MGEALWWKVALVLGVAGLLTLGVTQVLYQQGSWGRGGPSADDEDEDDPTQTVTLMETRTAVVTETKVEYRTIDLPQRYTTRGCPCAQSWTYNGRHCSKMCCNFDNDPKGEWCVYEDPIACKKKTGAPQDWGYCTKAPPLYDGKDHVLEVISD